MTETFQIVKARDLKAPKYRLRENLSGTLPGTGMDELKASIQHNGVLEPLLVRPVSEKLEVVAGQRRHLCAVELDIAVPVVVREMDDETAFLLALTENLERKSLDPIEEAKAYRRYIIDNGWGSVTDLSKKVHKSPSHISQLMSLLEQKDLVPLVESKKLTVSEATELVGLPPEKSKQLAEVAIKAGLEVPEIRAARAYVKAGMDVEQAVKRVVSLGSDIKAPPKNVEHYDPIQVALEDIDSELRQCLENVSTNLDKYVPDGEMKADYIKFVRYPIHETVNASIRLLKKYKVKKA